MIKDYYELTKPGLVYGNLIPLIGGLAVGMKAAQAAGTEPFLTASVAWLCAAAVIGLSLVMASGCVFNNYIDRDIDALMERTEQRALVAHRVSGRSAFVYAIILGVLGFMILAFGTHMITVAIAALGFFFYVFMYSLWSKRRTMYSVAIGAVAGAVPPVVGYAAAAGKIDLGAALLFIMLFLWQFPHFFAIAIRRSTDYAAAGIPVMPNTRGLFATKMKMAALIILFIIVAAALSLFGYASEAYLIIVLIAGCAWFALAVQGFWVEDAPHWARGMFFCSLIVLVAIFGTLALGSASFFKF